MTGFISGHSSSFVLNQHRAFLCGDVIERKNPIFKEKPFYAFLALAPTLLPDDFAVYPSEAGDEIVFAWMVPITKAEADFVRKNGWSKLEDLFVAQEVDLVDIDRSSLVEQPS